MGVLGSDSESNINPDSVSETGSESTPNSTPNSAPDPDSKLELGMLIANESPIACSSWVWV